MGRLIEKKITKEGATPLEDYSGLRVNIITREELNALEFQNINKAIKTYLLGTPSKQKAPFTYEWFLKLHREMFGDVWKWAGQPRKTNKNIGIDKTLITVKLKDLEKDYHYWTNHKMNNEECIARLHHQMVNIHPFENGNGRWARLAVNIHQKQNLYPLIHWPEKSIGQLSNARTRYLQALRKADAGDLNELIKIQTEYQNEKE